MTPANEFQAVTESIALWRQYDPESKTELFSTSLNTAAGLMLVDPILLTASAEAALLAGRTVAGIAITNDNHWRASAELARKFDVPLFAHSTASATDSPSITSVSGGDKILNAIETIKMDGAAPGEIALYTSAEDGTLVVGDALINFDPYGFTFLPPKYCTDPKKMRESLRQLVGYKVKRILFAHGMPIVTDAEHRLRQLLNQDRT